MSAKPIRIFYSELTGRFYASSRYRLESITEDGENGNFVITGEKFDVTNQIGAIVEEYQIEFVRKNVAEAPAPSASARSQNRG